MSKITAKDIIAAAFAKVRELDAIKRRPEPTDAQIIRELSKGGDLARGMAAICMAGGAEDVDKVKQAWPTTWHFYREFAAEREEQETSVEYL
jgi:hypothetical protein